MPEMAEKIFGDYESEEKTLGAAAQPSTPSTAIKIEEEKYGVAKPKRVQLRAKIIRDQDGTP